MKNLTSAKPTPLSRMIRKEMDKCDEKIRHYRAKKLKLEESYNAARKAHRLLRRARL